MVCHTQQAILGVRGVLACAVVQPGHETGHDALRGSATSRLRALDPGRPMIAYDIFRSQDN